MVWPHALCSCFENPSASCTPRRRLHLKDNEDLVGSLPSSVSALVSLRNLDISDCGLSGTLPETLSALAGLTRIGLDTTDVWGTIPAGYSALSNLKYGAVCFIASQLHATAT